MGERIATAGLKVDRKLHDFIEKEALPGTGVDPAAFTQKSVAFEAAVDELRAYYDQHPAERRSVENANGYINALAHYLVPEIKAISRRLESATVYTENELANNPLGYGNVAGNHGVENNLAEEVADFVVDFVGEFKTFVEHR